jgi:hypothetical protein
VIGDDKTPHHESIRKSFLFNSHDASQVKPERAEGQVDEDLPVVQRLEDSLHRVADPSVARGTSPLMHLAAVSPLPSPSSFSTSSSSAAIPIGASYSTLPLLSVPAMPTSASAAGPPGSFDGRFLSVPVLGTIVEENGNDLANATPEKAHRRPHAHALVFGTPDDHNRAPSTPVRGGHLQLPHPNVIPSPMASASTSAFATTPGGETSSHPISSSSSSSSLACASTASAPPSSAAVAAATLDLSSASLVSFEGLPLVAPSDAAFAPGQLGMLEDNELVTPRQDPNLEHTRNALAMAASTRAQP